MSRPAPIVRHDELETSADPTASVPAQAEIDAAHGTTGWSAYDVWRNRVFVPEVPGYKKPRGNT